MALVKKTIGRVPQNMGEWADNFVNPKTQQNGYGKKFRVILYGCEWESKIENNTFAPATVVDNNIVPDTTHWRLITGRLDLSQVNLDMNYLSPTKAQNFTEEQKKMARENIGARQDVEASYARKTDFDLDVLKQAVADGNLEKYGLKPGDQKTINGHTYVIAGLNPMKGPVTPYRVNQNHVGLIVIPHATHVWNADGKTTAVEGGHGAGYANSELHAYLQSDILPMCQNDLGAANLLAHSKLLTTAVNATGISRYGEATGCSSSWEWKNDQYISALSEVQVYGGTVWSSSGFDTGEACRQLEVFQRYSHTEIFGGEYPWLRDVVSASGAAIASGRGDAGCDTASNAYYVAALILFK